MDPWSLYFISGLVVAVIFCICFCCDRYRVEEISPSWRYLYYRVTQGPCPFWNQPPEMRRHDRENVAIDQTDSSSNQVFVVQSGK